MAARKKLKQQKPSLYNNVLKRFTAINRLLPEEKKLSLRRRRQIIKQKIIPALSGTPQSQIRVKTIKSLINLYRRKPSLYNNVLKRFTAINRLLPEEKKLSLRRRRQIIKQTIIPALSGTPRSQIRVKTIKSLINLYIGAMPIRSQEQCNINLIPPEHYSLVQWFEIDELLQRFLPDCIYVRVSAGRFGKTKIFNTRDYNYYLIGVQKITEKIRRNVDNKSGTAYYIGRQMLRPKMKNDGKAESYFIDFVLYLGTRPDNAEPQAPVGQITRYSPTIKTEKAKVQKASTRVGNELDVIFSKLSRERARKTRAYREVRKDERAIRKITKKKITPQNEVRILEQFAKKYPMALLKLDRYLAKGLITPARHKKAIKNLMELYKIINK
jgi:hypothetical protein